MKPGIYPNHERSRYDAFGAVNWSTLKALGKSPLHYQECLRQPPEQTPAMKLGEAAHMAVFEPARFIECYTVQPDFGDCRKKENKAARDEWRSQNTGSVWLTDEDYGLCNGIRNAVREHPLAARYLDRGDPEVSLVWEREGLGCKGRVDWLAETVIVDLKTTQDIALDRFQRQAANLEYHAQMAFYRDGHRRAAGLEKPLPCVLIAVESKPPHDVLVARYDEDALYYGDEVCTELLSKLRRCRAEDSWPGRYEVEQVLRLPAWMSNVEEDDLSVLDIKVGRGRAV